MDLTDCPPLYATDFVFSFDQIDYSSQPPRPLPSKPQCTLPIPALVCVSGLVVVMRAWVTVTLFRRFSRRNHSATQQARARVMDASASTTRRVPFGASVSLLT